MDVTKLQLGEATADLSNVLKLDTERALGDANALERYITPG